MNHFQFLFSYHFRLVNFLLDWQKTRNETATSKSTSWLIIILCSRVWIELFSSSSSMQKCDFTRFTSISIWKWEKKKQKSSSLLFIRNLWMENRLTESVNVFSSRHRCPGFVHRAPCTVYCTNRKYAVFGTDQFVKMNLSIKSHNFQSFI